MNNTEQDLGAIPSAASGHLLARNVGFNIVGQALPILIAFFSIPALIHSLGTEKFGVLALAWVLAGYFNLFDLGLGRAVVRIVVQKIPLRNGELFQAIWAAFVVSAVLGIFGGAVLYFSAEWLAVHFFAVNDQIHLEVLNSLKLMGFVIPFVVSSTIFRGVLEAFQKFDWINYAQVPIGALTYLLPLLMSNFTGQLPWIIATLVFARLLLWSLMVVMCAKCLRGYTKSFGISKAVMHELLSFGFWISMSNLIQPFLSYLDRFLIGSLISVVAVAYYTAPMEIVLKFWILPGAVISVIYPAFSAHVDSITSLRTLYLRSTRFLIIVIAPLSFTLSVMSYEILQLWISSEYAHQSATVLSILALGIFANCIGFVPSAFLQAIGKPSIPAKLHVIEFPLYAFLLYLGLKFNGLLGAATAWMIRVLFDSFALHFASLSRLESAKGLIKSAVSIAVFFVLAVLVLQLPFAYRVASVAAVFLLTPIVGWFYVLSLEDQNYLLNRLLRLGAVSRKSRTPRERRISKIGIAMAVYEPDPQMFLRQIQSIETQDFKNWICHMTVDSSLESLLRHPEVARALENPRFSVHQNPNRLGATKNFERAVEYVLREDVEAVAFCDQDDIWDPNKLTLSVQTLESKPQGSLVHCDMRVVELRNGEYVKVADSAWQHEDRQVNEQSPAHFLIRNCVTGAASLIDMDVLRECPTIPMSFKYHDQWYALLAASRGGVYPMRTPLYDYVQHGRNAVGVVPYQGFFYRPPGTSVRELFSRAVDSWWVTSRMIDEYQRAGFQPGFIEAAWRSKTLASTFIFLIIGMMHIRIDPSFARACVIKGFGGMIRSWMPDDKWTDSEQP